MSSIIPAIRSRLRTAPFLFRSASFLWRSYLQTDLMLGRRFYGDDNPFTRHLRSKLELSWTQWSRRSQSNGGAIIDTNALHSVGYTRLTEPYTPDLVNTIRDKALRHSDDQSYIKLRGQPDLSGKYYASQLLDAISTIPELRFLITPEITAGIENYYSSHFKIVGVDCTRIQFVPPDIFEQRDMFSSYWHCDHRRSTLLKMFYLVDDTTELNGPFHIQSREATRNAIRHYTDRTIARAAEPTGEYAVFTGKAGAVMFCNTTQCLHRASNPAPGHHRDLVQFRFMPSRIPLGEKWYDDPILHEIGNVGK